MRKRRSSSYCLFFPFHSQPKHHKCGKRIRTKSLLSDGTQFRHFTWQQAVRGLFEIKSPRHWFKFGKTLEFNGMFASEVQLSFKWTVSSKHHCTSSFTQEPHLESVVMQNLTFKGIRGIRGIENNSLIRQIILVSWVFWPLQETHYRKILSLLDYQALLSKDAQRVWAIRIMKELCETKHTYTCSIMIMHIQNMQNQWLNWEAVAAGQVLSLPVWQPSQRLGDVSQCQAPCHHTWLRRAQGLCIPSVHTTRRG